MNAENVLVLRALGLGDALTGVPARRGLRRRDPQARITVLAPAPVGRFLRTTSTVDAWVDVAGIESPLPVDALGSAAMLLHFLSLLFFSC